MIKVALLFVLLGGCTTEKPVEWFPRVTAWQTQSTCNNVVVDNSARLSVKEPDFCRAGKGAIISIGVKL
jgi:hypothetical protein